MNIDICLDRYIQLNEDIIATSYEKFGNARRVQHGKEFTEKVATDSGRKEANRMKPLIKRIFLWLHCIWEGHNGAMSRTDLRLCDCCYDCNWGEPEKRPIE